MKKYLISAASCQEDNAVIVSADSIDERTKLLYSLSIIVMSFVSLPNDNGKLIVSVFDSVDVPMPVITSRSEGL